MCDVTCHLNKKVKQELKQVIKIRVSAVMWKWNLVLHRERVMECSIYWNEDLKKCAIAWLRNGDIAEDWGMYCLRVHTDYWVKKWWNCCRPNSWSETFKNKFDL